MVKSRASFHESFKRSEEIKTSSDRSFGIVFAAVFLLITAYKAWHGSTWWGFWAAAGAAMAGLAMLCPKTLKYPNRLWMKFGLLLHGIVNPVILGILYYACVLPTGLIMRARGRDLLSEKWDKEASSYWIKRTPAGPDPKTMERQF